ncbi:MAG: protein-L-isoaspartate O-methyltransferase [candidate division WOR-3 bacterium]
MSENLTEIIKEWKENNYKIMERIERYVKDERIKNAFEKIPRNLFVKIDPFEDKPVYYAHGQTSSQPSLIAKMLELLEIKESDKVLEIGTGSGYLTAILCELSFFVYSIDIIEEFLIEADKKLKLLNYSNYKLLLRDGCKGLKEFSPYDKIIASAYFENISVDLLEQVYEGGIIVLPAGRKELQYIYKIVKYEPVLFVPMICN